MHQIKNNSCFDHHPVNFCDFPSLLLSPSLSSWLGSRSSSNSSSQPGPGFPVTKHQFREPWIPACPAEGYNFSGSTFDTTLFQNLTLCYLYFLIWFSYPLDCEILKDRDYVLFIFVFLAVLIMMLSQIGLSKCGLNACLSENSPHAHSQPCSQLLNLPPLSQLRLCHETDRIRSAQKQQSA